MKYLTVLAILVLVATATYFLQRRRVTLSQPRIFRVAPWLFSLLLSLDLGVGIVAVLSNSHFWLTLCVWIAVNSVIAVRAFVRQVRVLKSNHD